MKEKGRQKVPVRGICTRRISSYIRLRWSGRAATGAKAVKAEGIAQFDTTACRRSGAWTLMVSTACQTRARGLRAESLHPDTLHAGAVYFIKPHHLYTRTHVYARTLPLLLFRTSVARVHGSSTSDNNHFLTTHAVPALCLISPGRTAPVSTRLKARTERVAHLADAEPFL